MEKQIIYGVFAVDIELPKKSDKIAEIKAVAEAMIKIGEAKGRFVRAYKRLEDAVSECYDANGWLLTHKIEKPDGVANAGCTHFYFPKVIEVIGSDK